MKNKCTSFIFSFLFISTFSFANTTDSTQTNSNKSIFETTNQQRLEIQKEKVEKIDRNYNRDSKELKPDDYKNPTTAMWLSALLPGAGQIYNQEYWYIRVPVIWGGGFLLYNWYNQSNDLYEEHNKLYNDFYYLKIQKGQNAKANYTFTGRYSYLNSASSVDVEVMLNYFESRRDYYLEKRESAMIFLGLTYFAQIIDAYVVAKFLTFDIDENVELRVQPASVAFDPIEDRESISFGLQLKF